MTHFGCLDELKRRTGELSIDRESILRRHAFLSERRLMELGNWLFSEVGPLVPESPEVLQVAWSYICLFLQNSDLAFEDIELLCWCCISLSCRRHKIVLPLEQIQERVGCSKFKVLDFHRNIFDTIGQKIHIPAVAEVLHILFEPLNIPNPSKIMHEANLIAMQFYIQFLDFGILPIALAAVIYSFDHCCAQDDKLFFLRVYQGPCSEEFQKANSVLEKRSRLI